MTICCLVVFTVFRERVAVCRVSLFSAVPVLLASRMIHKVSCVPRSLTWCVTHQCLVVDIVRLMLLCLLWPSLLVAD